MPSPTLSRLLETTLAMRASIERGFYTTQKVLNFPAYLNFTQMGTEQEQGEIQKSWQIRVLDAGDDSVKPYGAFGPVTGRRKDVMSQMSVKPKFWQSHDNCMYDTFVMDGFNEESSNGFQFKLKDGDEDAAFEAVVSVLDKAYLNAPYSVDSDGVDGLLGAAYWAARSQTSGGTFVSQPEPARNGIYTTLRDGTVTGTIAGLDRTLARNARAQTNVATYGGVINQTLLETVSRMLVRMRYRYLSQFKGKQGNNTQGPNFCIYMELDKANAYRDFVNSLGGERRSDYWVAPLGVEMDGRMIQGTENFPSGLATIDAMLFVNHANLKLHTVKGKWGQTKQWATGPNSYVMPKFYAGQFRCGTPTDAVGMIHGSW